MNNHLYKLEHSGNLPPILAIDWGDTTDTNNYIFPNRTVRAFLEGNYLSLGDLMRAIRERRDVGVGTSQILRQARRKLRRYGWMVN